MNSQRPCDRTGCPARRRARPELSLAGAHTQRTPHGPDTCPLPCAEDAVPIADAASSPDDRHVLPLRPRRACSGVACPCRTKGGQGRRDITKPGRCGITRARRRVLVSHRLSALHSLCQEAGQVAVGLAGAVKFRRVTAAGQDVRGAQYSLTISAVTGLL